MVRISMKAADIVAKGFGGEWNVAETEINADNLDAEIEALEAENQALRNKLDQQKTDWNRALEAAAQLFPRGYYDRYFEDEGRYRVVAISDVILSLKKDAA